MERTTKLCVWAFASALILVSLVVLSLATAAFAASEDATAYRSNPAHTGQQTMPDFVQPVSVIWNANLGGGYSYPVIAGGKVFVIVTSEVSNNGLQTLVSALYALDAANGSVVWGPVTIPMPFAAYGAGLTYDNGSVFVAEGQTTTEGGLMLAYNASTGALEWSTTYGGQWWSDDFPTALDGYVYAQEAGNVSAIRESDGAVMWTTNQLDTEMGALAVTPTALYIAGGGGDSYELNPANGDAVWSLFTGVEGGGGYTPVYDASTGNLFVQDYYQTAAPFNDSAAINASTGAVVQTFTSEGSVAVDNGTMFGILNNAVVATNESNWSNLWTASNGIDLPVTLPTVVNGIVYVGTNSGLLDGYDERNGQETVSVPLGETPDNSPSAIGYSDMAAGDGIIVIPAGNNLVAVGTPFAQLTLTLNPAMPNGSNGWYTTPVKATVTTTAGTSHYTLDGGADTVYNAPVTISGDAKHTFTYWATDSSGDTTMKQNATVMIDSTPPVTTTSVTGAKLNDGDYGGSASIKLTATDNLSGVASTVYSIDGGGTTTYAGPLTISSAGSHTITYHSVDNAGNTEQNNTLSITIGPSVLHSFPAGLQMISTPQDDTAFTLSQIFDTSPVTLAWWNPTDFNYAITPTSPANTMHDGLGYWVRFANPTNLLSVGQPTNPSNNFTISLSKGWNMVGNPEPNSVALDILTVMDGSGNSFPVGQAGSLVGQVFYTWQAGDTAYEAIQTGGLLQPFEGYWVFAFVPCTLEFPGNPGAPPGGPFVRAHR